MSVETVVAEESAYQMVSEATVDRTNAIQKIMDGIYVHNREHADVISSICSLFIELSHYGQTLLTSYKLVTFCMRRSRGERYSGHGRPCVCLSVPRHIPSLGYCTDPDVSWGNGTGCPVVHYWADLQSVHGFLGYDNSIVPNEKCHRVLVLALCLVELIST